MLSIEIRQNVIRLDMAVLLLLLFAHVYNVYAFNCLSDIMY